MHRSRPQNAPTRPSLAAFAITALLATLFGFASPANAAAACGRLAWVESARSSGNVGNGANGDSEIIVADTDGNNRTVLPSIGSVTSPEWSPDGARLAWRSLSPDAASIGEVDLVLIDPDGTNERRVRLPAAFQFEPAWSPDGSQIAVGGNGIFLVDMNGAISDEISAADQSSEPPIGSTDPAWSPDGTRIAWVGQPDRFSPTEIYVADADGQNRTSIGEGRESPQWSPSGDQLAFVARDSSTGDRIVVVDADGTNRSVVSGTDATAPTSSLGPQWSPNGTQLVWQGTAPGTGLSTVYVATADGGGRTPVTTVGASQPRWSPDGTRVAFFGGAITLGEREIYTMRSDGTDLVRVSDGDSSETTKAQPEWSPACTGGGGGGVAGFTDVDPGAFYADAVVWLKDEGITTGTSATTYSPDDNVTRAQMAAFLHRMVGEPGGNPAHGFRDVPDGAFYTEAVRWLKDQGITTGTSATTYSPDDNVTRAQMAAFLFRLAGEPGGNPAHGFRDVPDGAFYTEAVRWLKDQGITTGTSATTYSPDDNVTRAQMAAFLFRMATDSDWDYPGD